MEHKVGLHDRGGAAWAAAETVAVGGMILSLIDPEPPHNLRIEELEGKTLLLVEVAPASGVVRSTQPSQSSTFGEGRAPCPHVSPKGSASR